MVNSLISWFPASICAYFQFFIVSRKMRRKHPFQKHRLHQLSVDGGQGRGKFPDRGIRRFTQAANLGPHGRCLFTLLHNISWKVIDSSFFTPRPPLTTTPDFKWDIGPARQLWSALLSPLWLWLIQTTVKFGFLNRNPAVILYRQSPWLTLNCPYLYILWNKGYSEFYQQCDLIPSYWTQATFGVE